MKILVSLVLLAAVCVSAEPPWVDISTVATNPALSAQWRDFTDFIADTDPAPDGYLYIKLWDGTGIPWQGDPG